MKLSIEQGRAVRAEGAIVGVSAGAGSGKTRVLVERYLYLAVDKGVDPERILAITFTDKAAGQIKERLAAETRRRNLSGIRRQLESAPIGTIHSFCSRVLKEHPVEAGVDPAFRVLAEAETEILRHRTLDLVFEEETDSAGWLDLMLAAGEDALRGAVGSFYGLSRSGWEWSGGKGRVFDHEFKTQFERVSRRFASLYDAQKRAQGLLDFDDLLYFTDRLLADDTPARRAVRDKYRSRFAAILVDEYQDTNLLQDRIVEALKSPGALFIVGDVQQSIYAFRQADPEIFQRRLREAMAPATKASAGRRAGTFHLRRNYRTRPEIIRFVNALFADLTKGSFEPLVPVRKAEPGPAVEVLCVRAEEGLGLDRSRVREARSLAWYIREAVKKKRFKHGDIALLFRSLKKSHLYEKELADAGIPFHVIRPGDFFEKPEVRDLVNFLSLLENPLEDVPLAGVLRSPLVGIGDETLFWLARTAKSARREASLWNAVEKEEGVPEIAEAERGKIRSFLGLLKGLRGQKDSLGLSELVLRALRETDYEARLMTEEGGRQKAANVRKLVDLLERLGRKNVFGIGDLVWHLSRLSEQEIRESEAHLAEERSDSVRLLTVHQAKGLEFPCVIVADMGRQENAKPRGPFLAREDEGLGLNIDKSPDACYQRINEALKLKESAEQDRVLYVALTRARERLVLSGAAGGSSATWMARIVKAMGLEPAAKKTFKWKGLAIGLVPVHDEPPPRPRAKRPLAEDPAFRKALAEPSPARDWESAFRQPEKPYEQTDDTTVSALAARAAEGGRVMEEPDQDDPDAMPADEYGTLFHRVMELLAHSRPARVPESFFRSPFLQPLTDETRARLKKDTLVFWDGPWGAEVRSSKKRYPELPFVYNTGRGLLRGQIDLIYQTKEGEWVLLDYKTGAVTAAHELQLSLYALVFKRLTGEEITRGVLYFSATGETIEFPYAGRDEEAVERRLETLIFQDGSVMNNKKGSS